LPVSNQKAGIGDILKLMDKVLPPTTLVIFGVSGDLSRRYLLPALAEICQNSDFRAHLNILGLSRRDIQAKEVLPPQAAGLAGQFQVMRLDYEQPGEYQRLKAELERQAVDQVIFYFAVPPEASLPIVRQLGAAGLNGPTYKLLMEKPFGTDLASAKSLIDEIDQHFKPEQVFRIDHYLAKEVAQNIAVFLGSNALFRDVWNNQFIEKVEIVAEESIGIEGRAHFYEQTGALRDIVQSHLLQLTALTIMEPCPELFDFSQMPQRRLAALKQLLAVPDSVIKGQYQGYKNEVNNQKSTVETFVKVDLVSTDPQWQNVPIRLVTGKCLNDKLTEIRVFFEKAQSAQSNLLKLRIQPREGIELELWVKRPGYDQDLQMLPLDFNYQQYFDRLPDAYEQVIVDAVRGRANLFASSGEVLASWEILQPLLDKWHDYELKIYQPGASAEEILKNT
jgi:glucose-6-phosphate 1-dehydrogenase